MNGRVISDNAYLDGGFRDPVFQSQSVFRAVMDAMAKPGTLIDCTTTVVPPRPLTPIAAAIACTLCDGDTPVFLDVAMSEAQGVEKWFAFQTGAPVTRTSSTALFALIANPRQMPTLESFAVASQENPETSTTLILILESLNGGTPMRLTGPGVKTEAQISPFGLPDHFLSGWERNQELFPRGVDVILTGPEGLVGLPRTTRLFLIGD